MPSEKPVDGEMLTISDVGTYGQPTLLTSVRDTTLQRDRENARYADFGLLCDFPGRLHGLGKAPASRLSDFSPATVLALMCSTRPCSLRSDTPTQFRVNLTSDC